MRSRAMRICLLILLLTISPAGISAAAKTPPAPVLNPSDNAALYYYQAFELHAGIDAINRRSAVDSAVATWDLPLDKQMRKALKACRPAMRFLHLGSQMPYCRWGHRIPLAKWGFSAPLPELAPSRALVDATLFDVRLLWSQGHWQKAAQRIQDVFILAHRIGKNGTLVGALVGLSTYSITIQMMANHLATVPEAALPALQKMLTQIPPPDFVRDALVLNCQQRINNFQQITLAGHSGQLNSTWRLVWIWGINHKAEKPPGTKIPPPPPMPADFRQQVLAAIPKLAKCKKQIAATRRQSLPDLLDILNQIHDQRIRWNQSKNDILRFESMSHSAYRLILRYNTIFELSALRAALAYRCGGRPAFNKIQDAFGTGPYKLEWRPDQLVICSHLGESALKELAKKLKLKSELIIPLHLPQR